MYFKWDLRTVFNSLFERNSVGGKQDAGAGYGSALFLSRSTSSRINSSYFFENTALELGTVYSADCTFLIYDCKFENQLNDDFVTHLSMMAGNFSVLWLYSKYLGLTDPIPIEDKYKIVQKTLKEKFVKVYDSDKFEKSWDEIAKELNVTTAPRLQSNRAGESYNRLVKFSNLSKDFINWHRGYNNYDYLLYEEFCT